jgi:hypothetical protein
MWWTSLIISLGSNPYSPCYDTKSGIGWMVIHKIPHILWIVLSSNFYQKSDVVYWHGVSFWTRKSYLSSSVAPPLPRDHRRIEFGLLIVYTLRTLLATIAEKMTRSAACCHILIRPVQTINHPLSSARSTRWWAGSCISLPYSNLKPIWNEH